MLRPRYTRHVMASTLEDIEAAAMALSTDQRVELAEHLLTSVHFDRQLQSRWLDEAERRHAKMESGEDPGLTIEEFFSDDAR
jgi:putative addiction module component (TIGR02574 family)